MCSALGSIWLQESIIYAHAALFLLAAAWTLQEGGHVRVDMFYAERLAAHEGAGSICSARCCCCCRSWRSIIWFRAALCGALLGDP